MKNHPNTQTNAGDPTGRTARWARLSQYLGALWLAHPRLHAVLLKIAGVDAAKLAQCPQDEKTVYPTLGALMVLAACFTAMGVTAKLSAGLELGALGTVAVFGMFLAFSLGLEMVILSTLKVGTGALRGLLLRLALGMALMLLQVAPLLVWMFQPLIDQHQNTMVLKSKAQAKELAQKAYDLPTMEARARQLRDADAVAQAAMLDPKPSPRLRSATERVEQASKGLASAMKAVDDAKMRQARAEAEWTLTGTNGDPRVRAAIEKAIEYWKGQLASRRKAMNDAEAERSNAETDRAAIAKAWNDQLESNAAMAAKQRQEHESAVKAATDAVEADTQKAAELARKAAASRFFNDAAALLSIMPAHPSVVAVSLFVLAIALLVDLMPLYTKMQLSRSVYAQLVEDECAVTRASSAAMSAQSVGKIATARLEAENEAAGMRNWVAQDAGATGAAIHALRAEIGRDSLAVAAQSEVAMAGFDAILKALEKAREVHALVKSDPGLATVFQVQLEALIAKLEAAAHAASPQPRAT